MSQTLQTWYGRHKVLVWIITGLALCYTLAGFVVTPMVVQHLLKNKVSRLIDRKIDVRSVYANPYTFSMRLSDLSVTERDGSAFMDVKELSFNVQPVASLFQWGMVVKTVSIKKPGIRIIRTAIDQFNFSDMLTTGPEKNPVDSAEAKKPLRLILSQFDLEQGSVDYIDTAGAAPFQSTLSSITFALNHLDTEADAGPTLIELSARSEAEEKIQASGQVDIAPLNVIVKLNLENLQIAKYAPYYGPMINARISEGALGVQASIHWSAGKQLFGDILATITRLAVTPRDSGQALIRIPEFKVDGAEVDLKQQTIQLGRVTSRNGEVHAARNDRGEIDLLAAFSPQTTDHQGVPETSRDNAPANTPGWLVNMPELNIEGYSIHFRDEQVSPPAQLGLSDIALSASALTTQKNSQGTAALNLNWADQGNLSVQGQFGLMPLQAALDVKAQDLDIRPLQPYINDYARLVVTQGTIDTKGRLQVVAHDTDLDLRYNGQAALNGFQSVDTKQTGDFLKWKSLFLDGLELNTAPFGLLINEVALTDFFSRLIIFEDGSSNLQAISGRENKGDAVQTAAQKTKPEPTDPSADTAPNIRINTITLQGGKVDFSDLFIKPNVRLPMTAMGGRISGLDAIKTHRADVLLRGMVNGNVPMEIKGQFNPFIEKPYIDLSLDFVGIDLSPFTPYSGKYLGYKLDKGQLSLKLAYLVADNKLTGQNKVLLNQLTLGETIASPKATKLPIKLALALLKDRKGNIDLDLPVSGNLDDPEFSIGGIVVKMFVNLIVNIVTSPFKMLGALFGGGEDLAYLDFEPGQGELPAKGTAKLDTLAKILFERPGLNLEIQGEVNPAKDMDGLRRIRFEQELVSTQINAGMAKGQKAVPLKAIVLTPAERESLILEAYAAAQFPKPRDDKGQLKTLSPAEMEKLLYTAIALSNDDLRLLAHQRAAAAKRYLVQTAKVQTDRLFVIEPKVEAESQKETLQARVQFYLK